MADYTAREWSSGDIVTAANLNHIEQGVASASGGSTPLVVNVDTNGTLDKTWQEIYDALSAPSVVIVPSVSADEVMQNFVTSAYHDTEEGTYSVNVRTIGLTRTTTYVATSADGYPQRSVG